MLPASPFLLVCLTLLWSLLLTDKHIHLRWCSWGTWYGLHQNMMYTLCHIFLSCIGLHWHTGSVKFLMFLGMWHHLRSVFWQWFGFCSELLVFFSFFFLFFPLYHFLWDWSTCFSLLETSWKSDGRFYTNSSQYSCSKR